MVNNIIDNETIRFNDEVAKVAQLLGRYPTDIKRFLAANEGYTLARYLSEGVAFLQSFEPKTTATAEVERGNFSGRASAA